VIVIDIIQFFIKMTAVIAADIFLETVGAPEASSVETTWPSTKSSTNDGVNL